MNEIKKVEELGISPAPWMRRWYCCPNDIVDANGKWTADAKDFDEEHAKYAEADANLIAAAPELYEALRELVEIIEDGVDGGDDPDYYVEHAKAALTKAAGGAE